MGFDYACLIHTTGQFNSVIAYQLIMKKKSKNGLSLLAKNGESFAELSSKDIRKVGKEAGIAIRNLRCPVRGIG